MNYPIIASEASLLHELAGISRELAISAKFYSLDLCRDSSCPSKCKGEINEVVGFLHRPCVGNSSAQLKHQKFHCKNNVPPGRRRFPLKSRGNRNLCAVIKLIKSFLYRSLLYTYTSGNGQYVVVIMM